MNLMKPLVGGLAGGITGLLVWAIFAYFTHQRLAWFAVGVGGLVGFGVLLRSTPKEKKAPETGSLRELARKSRPKKKREQSSYEAPAMAAGVALVLAIVGKGAAAFMSGAGLKAEAQAPKAGAPDIIALLAGEVCRERMTGGKRITWPADKSLDTATSQNHFPADIWQEASRRWDKLGQEEQDSRLAAYQKTSDAIMQESAQIRRTNKTRAATYDLWDGLWFLLGSGAAFGLNFKKPPKEED